MTQPRASHPSIAGVLLAAGMGRRFGGPKALADTGDGPWVLRALGTLASLEPRIVVVGAEAGRVRALLPDGVIAADNPDFASGMGSSLVAGLRALDTSAVDAAVIMLVDLPDVPAAAVDRVVDAAWRGAGASGSIECDEDRARAESPPAPAHHEGGVIHALRQSLTRATFHGTPGHPVLIGADHIAGVIEAAGGDRGARDYLATHPVMAVECGDLGGGEDVDRMPSGG
jgi:CTP:molybdopterin cytidylyltransferase MocA